MSVPSEYQVGIAACLDAIIQAFKDGGAIIEKIKRKRALKRAPPPPRLLEESIDQAPNEIEREKQRGLKRYGKAFEAGDHLAVIALQQICIQLQQSLLEKLRNAAFDDDKAITDFTYLVDAADQGRDRTIAALYEFKNRLSRTEQEQYGQPVDDGNLLQPVVSNTSAQSSASNLSSLPSEQANNITAQTIPPSVGSSPTSPPTQRQILQEYEAERQRRMSRAPIWTREYNRSRDASGEEDATGGADDSNHSANFNHRKRSSLLHFLKHTRTHSFESKDKMRGRGTSVLAQPISEETTPTPPKSPTIVPYQPPEKCDASIPEKQPQDSKKFTYEDWDDNASDIWGVGKNTLERRETVSLAPDQPSSNSTSASNLPLPPPSPVLTYRTNSNTYFRDIAPAQHLASTAVVTPNPENDFLGFCKGAWKLQNGDRKGSMHKASEVNPWSRHQSVTANQYLSCQQPRCAFRSSFSCPEVDTIWKKVFTIENKGIQLRWSFLAKSHVTQKVVIKHQYSFRCLFCTFLGGKEASGVYHGMDYYLDHINNEHRGRLMNDVICYKTGCIQGRIANEDEEFDINIWPPGVGGSPGDRKQSEWHNDDFMRDQGFPYGGWGSGKDGKSDSMFSDEPWNEGLSDFHYHGDLDPTEFN